MNIFGLFFNQPQYCTWHGCRLLERTYDHTYVHYDASTGVGTKTVSRERYCPNENKVDDGAHWHYKCPSFEIGPRVKVIVEARCG